MLSRKLSEVSFQVKKRKVKKARRNKNVALTHRTNESLQRVGSAERSHRSFMTSSKPIDTTDMVSIRRQKVAESTVGVP